MADCARLSVWLFLNIAAWILNFVVFVRKASHDNFFVAEKDSNLPCEQTLIKQKNHTTQNMMPSLTSYAIKKKQMGVFSSQLMLEPSTLPTTLFRKSQKKSELMSGRLGAWWFWKENAPKEVEDPDSLRARLQPVHNSPHPTSDEECRDYLRSNSSLYKSTTNETVKVGMCVAIRNGGRRLEEWVAYHVTMGISKIDIYDDHSTDNPQKILKKYIDAGIVEFRNHTRGKEGTVDTQIYYVRSCVKNFFSERTKTQIQWVALIDVDEFLMPRKWKADQHIGDLLPNNAFSPEAPLCVQTGRVQYGSSYHMQMPSGLIIESYTLRAPMIFVQRFNKLPKILVNLWHHDANILELMIRTLGIHGSHRKECKCKKYQIQPYGSKSNNYDGLRINHYLGSAADWMVKVTTHRIGTKKFLGGFNMFLPKDFDTVYDDNALPYVCQVKQEMGLLSET